MSWPEGGVRIFLCQYTNLSCKKALIREGRIRINKQKLRDVIFGRPLRMLYAVLTQKNKSHVMIFFGKI